MTFVKGASTWGRIEHDLARLICGEMADDYGITVASGDKWVREATRTVTDGVLNSTTTITSATAAFTASDVGSLVIGTGIPVGTTIATFTNSTTVVLSAAATATNTGVTLQITTNTIRTPATKDVASGNMSNRCGYFSNLGISNGAAPFEIPAVVGAGQNTVCKVTSAYTVDPSTGGFHRWIVNLAVATANSVINNYSTASISRQVIDADTGATLISSSLTPSATGDITIGTGCTVNITDSSGFLTVGTRFVRAFTDVYMRGIDHWPMLSRAAGAHSFSVAPPGVAATDYDIVKISHPPQSGLNSVVDRSNLFHGLGIKTSTGLGSNPLYTVSFPMALAKGRIFASATAGVLSLDVGQSLKDSANSTSTFRNCGGFRITGWLRMFQTPGSVTSSSTLQYWVSVTSDGIMIVLSGDPGSTGKIGTAYYGVFTSADPVYDVFPVMANYAVADNTVDSTGQDFVMVAQFPYWSLRRRQDGSEGSRDWQTKWMRAEQLRSAFSSGMNPTDVVSSSQVSNSANTTSTQLGSLTAVGTTTTSSASSTNYMPTRELKPSIDGAWWLYGFMYGESGWSAATATVDETRHIRGLMTTRFLYIPESGWVSGDELTDQVSGAKYYLVAPDYPGAGGRMKSATNTYWGGVAVAEI